MHFYEQQTPEGHTLRLPGTLWRNTTGQTIRFTLRHREGIPREREGAKWWPPLDIEHVFRPGESKVLPTEHDRGVQMTQCQHPKCMAPPNNPLACNSDEEGHEKVVVGGLGHNLTRVDDQGGEHPPRLHPAIEPQRVGPPAISIDDLDQLSQRLAARRSST
jgi:hypothetical protein